MKTALIIVDHGSRRAAANANLGKLLPLVQERAPFGTIVDFAHMELAPPTIAETVAKVVAAGATRVVVHPYMLAAGRHAQEDIPEMVREIALEHPSVSFEVTEPLGIDRLLAELVLKRAGIGLGEGIRSSER